VHQAQLVTGDPGHAVVRREPFVEKGVIAIDEFGDAAIRPDQMLEIHLGLAAHELTKGTVKLDPAVAIGARVPAQDGAGVDWHGFDVARLEPLTGEVAHKSLRLGVLQHSLDLSAKVAPQFVVVRQSKEFLVGHRRPQKIRKPGSQCVVIRIRHCFDTRNRNFDPE
jgi:hypothetical protein